MSKPLIKVVDLVGLALMMFLSYGTINYKVYDKDELGLDKVSMDALDEEEVPITSPLFTYT